MARDKAYRNAQERIERARRSGGTELNLSWMELTELPESLGRLTQLQSLKLGNNPLTELPEWLGQLTQLQSLSLDNNQLTALPEWLGRLTQLQSLDLWSNQLTALPDSISNISGLTRLWIGNHPEGGNPMAVVPQCICHLKQLEALGLSQSEIDILPDWLGELTSLKYLYLTATNLKDLPASLAQLEHLEAVSVDKNSLNPELAAAYEEGFRPSSAICARRQKRRWC